MGEYTVRESVALRALHLHNKMIRLNKKLDTVEEEIEKNMRVGSPLSEILISERENIKGKLKDIHNKLYGETE